MIPVSNAFFSDRRLLGHMLSRFGQCIRAFLALHRFSATHNWADHRVCRENDQFPISHRTSGALRTGARRCCTCANHARSFLRRRRARFFALSFGGISQEKPAKRRCRRRNQVFAEPAQAATSAGLGLPPSAGEEQGAFRCTTPIHG